MNILLIVVLYIGFISLGLPDQILGVAWPSMRANFGLPLDFAGILIITTSICTTISSFSSGYLVKKFDVAGVLILSAALTAFSMMFYGLAPFWWLVVLVTIPLGLGAGAVDSVLNDFVSKNLTARHMNFLHGFWALGATLGPAIMTFVLAFTKSWRPGYLIIGLLQFILLLLFIFTRKLWRSNGADKMLKDRPKLNLFTPAPFASAMFFFIYTALEGTIGVWICSILIEDRGISREIAGLYTTIYWAALTLGRFANGYFAPRLNCSKVISYSLLAALLGICLMFVNDNYVMLLALIITGMAFSGIYPCMMFETSARFAPDEASVLTGYQVGFACLGYALLIPLVGSVIAHLGLDLFVIILLVMCLSLVALDYLLYRALGRRSFL